MWPRILAWNPSPRPRGMTKRRLLEVGAACPSPLWALSVAAAPSLAVTALMSPVPFARRVGKEHRRRRPHWSRRSNTGVGRRQGPRRPRTRATAAVPAATDRPAEHVGHEGDRPGERGERAERNEGNDHERDQPEPRGGQEDDRRNDHERRPCVEVPHHDLSFRIGVGAYVTVRGSLRGAALASAD